MAWQDSFIPDQTQQATQAQGWQASFVPDGQEALPQSMPGEELFRQVGLAGRDLAGAIPMAVAGGGDLLNKGINYVAGTNLGMPTEGVQKGLSATGLFPEYGNNIEKGIGDVASVLFSFGENGPRLAKQTYNNGKEILVGALKSGGEETASILPKSGDIKLIKKKLEMAGITPEQYADALRKSSPEDFAGELGGDPLRMQTQAQAKITGPAMQEARDAMRQRLETAPQRVQQIIEKTFYPSSAAGPVVGGDASVMKGSISPIEPVEQLQANLVDVKNKLPDLYSAANDATVTRRASLGVINTPAGQKALEDTVTKLANQSIQPGQAGIVIDAKTGFHGLSKEVPVSTLHELSKSLGDQVARNPLTGAIEDSQSLVIEGLRKHITSYLAENSPEFNAANMNAAAQLQGQSAFEAGRKLAHAAAGENADALMQRAGDTYSAQELSHHKAGYAQGLADALQGNPLGGGNPAGRIAKGTVQNTAAEILQSPTQGQKFAEALMQEKNRIELAQRGLGGLNTAETLTSGIPEVPTSLHGMAAGAFNKVKDFVQAGKNERIAQLLYATDPDTKEILAKMLVGK